MRRTLLFGTLFWLLTGAQVWAQANLENPPPGSNQSGIALVSGWKCTAGTVTVQFDNSAPFPVAYGTPRGDTQSVCGDDNNGFGLLWNYNLLGDGQHTVTVFDNGTQFAQATFTVATFGVEFLRGASKTLTTGFGGCRTALVWQESQQNFVVAQTDACFQPLLGQWEFVTKEPTGDERDHYRLDHIETEPVENDGVTEVEGIVGTDLDHGGAVAVIRVSDLETPTSVPYTFFLASLLSSRCEAFFFNQTDANNVTGVGLSYPSDPISGCENLPSPAPTLSPMTGTKTGAALSKQEARESVPQAQFPGQPLGTSVSNKALAEILKKTLPLLLHQEP